MVRRRAAPSRTVRPQTGHHPSRRRYAAPQDEGRERRVRRSKVAEGAFLYILRCSDGSFYIGITRTALEIRIAQHNAGTFGGYTATRRPVSLVFSQWFDRVTDAIENERNSRSGVGRRKKPSCGAISQCCDSFQHADHRILRGGRQGQTDDFHAESLVQATLPISMRLVAKTLLN
jgi:putative endonuclease